MAVFYFVINLSKWIPYAWLGLLDGCNLATSVVLLPVVPFGVWIGLLIAKCIDPGPCDKLVYLGMFLTGAELLCGRAA